MGKANSGDAWITIMSNVNILAVASLTDCACIILSEGVTLSDEIIETAKEKGINVLSFAKYLSQKKIPVVIRHVLVPTINDDVESLEKLADFICTLENVHKIEILAYHDMAKSKYEALKIKYPLSDIRVATKEDVKRAEQIISNRIKSNFS
jgi:pyruvate-formate lyase-activating enzyme